MFTYVTPSIFFNEELIMCITRSTDREVPLHNPQFYRDILVSFSKKMFGFNYVTP